MLEVGGIDWNEVDARRRRLRRALARPDQIPRFERRDRKQGNWSGSSGLPIPEIN